jgi:23S rRNA pseudouridine1911/1915/1917 synthase
VEILFENNDIIVVIKEPGLSSEDGENSVPKLIREHLGKSDAYVGIISRLDTAVGGVMVYAKTKTAAANLSRQVTDGSFKKEYICVCVGKLDEKSGTMRDFLFKDSRKNKVFPVKSLRKGAKEAILDYEVLSEKTLQDGTDISLCSVRLHTGRTHQIRVQFASRKHPLIGDGKYGSRVKAEIALWCKSICFTVPGEKEAREFIKLPHPVFPFSVFEM